MFDEIAKDVMTKRKNFGAPEIMCLKELNEMKNLIGQTITIDSIVARNKIKYNTKTNEPLMTKKGEPIYQCVIYIAYNGDKFTATKSPLIIEELKMLCDDTFIFNEKKDVEITVLNGTKVKIGTDIVTLGKGKDAKDYDYPIFVDA